MNTGQLVSSLISGVAVLILAAIGKQIMGLHREFRKFMAEHVWLIATTLWTRDKVTLIMKRLDIPLDNPPPDHNRWGDDELCPTGQRSSVVTCMPGIPGSLRGGTGSMVVESYLRKSPGRGKIPGYED